jgi:drug/metabolite transporter (DMT)-like permease
MEIVGMCDRSRSIVAVLAGACCIATSAILMRLAGSSASAAAVFRCLFALPILAMLMLRQRSFGHAPLYRGRRWIARLSGLFLAADLVVWSHGISAIGAGLATVLGNLQVLLVALLAWWLLRERPHRSLALSLPVMLIGVALVGGVLGSGHAGTSPLAGVLFGVVASSLYAGFILLLRQSMAVPDAAPGASHVVVAALYNATLGGAVGSIICAVALRDFRIGPWWPALGWLLLLAVTSQVVGWLLISRSLSRLPASLSSALLLVQPVGATALGALIFGERPSLAQLAGVALILAGVLVAARQPALRRRHVAPRVVPLAAEA